MFKLWFIQGVVYNLILSLLHCWLIFLNTKVSTLVFIVYDKIYEFLCQCAAGVYLLQFGQCLWWTVVFTLKFEGGLTIKSLVQKIKYYNETIVNHRFYYKLIFDNPLYIVSNNKTR